MIKKIAVFMLTMAVLLLGSCHTGTEPHEKYINVVFSVESTDIYGILTEYSFDRTRTGGMELSADPGKTIPLTAGSKTLQFTERMFPHPERLENSTFGILVYIITKDGGNIPLEYLWEWNARYGESYFFTLSGDNVNGYELTPEKGKTRYEITPWSELPEEFLA